jgi:AcrR family transcriptional regulator
VPVPSPPTRPALKDRYESRRRELVDTAARLFAERGYHGTSIEDLLDATGLTRGGLYHYIDSKHDLLFAIHEQLMEPLLGQARAIAASEEAPEAQLRRLVRAWMAHVEGHRHHMVVFDRERRSVRTDPRYADAVAAREEFERILDAILRAGQQAGAFAVADRPVALLAFLGMVNYAPQWYDPDGRLGPDEIADGFCDLVLGGLRVS